MNSNNQNQELKEEIPKAPRDKNDMFFNCFPENNNKRINILFVCSTGLKVTLCVPIDIKIKDLLLSFIQCIGLSEKSLGKDIAFLFNSCMINAKEETNIIKYGLKNNCSIIVVDQRNVYGGDSLLFNKI